MKKLILTLATILLTSTIWSTAFAGHIVAYNSSYGQPIKIVKQGYTGSHSHVVDVSSDYTWVFEGGCVKVLRTTQTLTQVDTYEFGDLLNSEEHWSEPVTQTIFDVCP